MKQKENKKGKQISNINVILLQNLSTDEFLQFCFNIADKQKLDIDEDILRLAMSAKYLTDDVKVLLFSVGDKFNFDITKPSKFQFSNKLRDEHPELNLRIGIK